MGGAIRRKGGTLANTQFTVKTHGILPGNQMVQFSREGVFMAGIYPHEDGIRIVSKYMDWVEREPGYPPAVVVHLIEDS